MSKKTNNNRHLMSKFLTPDTYDDYVRLYHPPVFTHPVEGYGTAAYAAAKELNRILRKAKSYKELKKEITDFSKSCSSLHEFIVFEKPLKDLNDSQKLNVD